jgi:hypothetical protein
MAHWIFFMHPERENFIETMTKVEQTACADHTRWFKGIDDRGAPRRVRVWKDEHRCGRL